MCDAGGQNQLSETIGNLGLWTEPGIPTKATRLETHHLVRFLFGFSLPCWILCRVAKSCGASRFYFNQWLQFQPNPAPCAKNTKNRDAKCDATANVYLRNCIFYSE